MSFSSGKYDRRVGIYQALRRGANAITNAIEDGKKIVEWDPTDLPQELRRTNETLFKGMEATSAYMSRYSAAAMEIICRPEFSLGYSIFGDIHRNPVLGPNTVGIDMDLVWETCEVESGVYIGHMSEMMISVNARDVFQNQAKDRALVSKAMGWDRQQCYTMTPSQVGTLTTLLDTARGGFAKYTRLVKGCLHYLDLLHYGEQNVKKYIPTIVQYELNDVLAAYQVSDRAYIYCSDPDSMQYLVALSCMAEQYPNNDTMCYAPASIPADGEEIAVVINGWVPNVDYFTVTQTPQSMMASIIKYATESGNLDELESALIVACSMYENRYISRVDLPKVVSVIDLVLPAFTPASEMRAARPAVTRELVQSIGRLHQMLMFVTIKDIIIAARTSTKQGFNYGAVIRQYFSLQEEVVSKMSGVLSPLQLLDMTRQLKWLYKIDEEAIADIDSISMFEGLWLCDGGNTGVRNGGITVFKKGVSDMMPDNPYHRVLTDELRKTNVVLDMNRLPRGSFTIASRYARVKSVKRIVTRELVEEPVVMAQECDFDPGDDIRLKSFTKIRMSAAERRKFIASTKSKVVVVEHEQELERPTGKGSDESSSRSSKSTGRMSFTGKPVIPVGLMKPKSRSEVDVLRAVQAKRRSNSNTSNKSVTTKSEVSEVSTRRNSKIELWSRKILESVEASKGSKEVESDNESNITTAEIEVIHTDKLMRDRNEKGSVVEIMVKEGVTPGDIVGGNDAALVAEGLRSKYDEKALSNSELVRIIQIFRGLEDKVDLRNKLTYEELKHLANVRDTFHKTYRSADSGRSRRYREIEGKVLAIETSIRRFRASGHSEEAVREKISREYTGIFHIKRIDSLAREFFLSSFERKMYL
nr:capsid protein [Leptosphaeria biglobosa chrysovirus 1]